MRGRRLPLPGAHPLAFGEELVAGAGWEKAAAAWAETPGAAILLPVGRSFDLLDVPEAAGRNALARLERMGLPLGPVAVAPTGRALFFVAPARPGSSPICCTGWAGTTPRWTCAPWARRPSHRAPSDLGGHGPVCWLRPPTLDTAGRPPQARLMVGTLAYACNRSAV